MKKILFSIASGIALAMTFVACSNEMEEPQPKENGTMTITVTLPEAPADTRIAYEELSENQGVKTTWQVGDALVAYNRSGYKNSGTFVIAKAEDIAEGGKTATFTGPELDDSMYDLMNPAGKMDETDITSILFDWRGQEQAANGDMAHLSDFDYIDMALSIWGGVTDLTSMNRYSALVQFDITLPAGVAMEGINKFTISHSETEGIAITRSMTRTVTYAQELSLDLGDIDLAADETLTLWMMLPELTTVSNTPTFKAGTINLTLTNGTDTYAAEPITVGAAGKVYAGNKRYYFEAGMTLLPPVEDDGSTSESLPGEGTETTPYLIGSAADLRLMRDKVNESEANAYSRAWYKLTKNIELNDGSWEAIGDAYAEGYVFYGNFDGDGYTIMGTITGENDAYFGLFGMIGSDAKITNLTLNAAVVNTGEGMTGGIAGRVSSTVITNCHFIGTINGATVTDVTGIAGGGATDRVTYCTVNGNGI